MTNQIRTLDLLSSRQLTDEEIHTMLCRLADVMAEAGWFCCPECAWEVMRSLYQDMTPSGELITLRDIAIQVGERIGQDVTPLRERTH